MWVDLIEPEVEGFDASGADLADERAPEVAAAEGPLDARSERVEGPGVLRIAPPLVAEQPPERVLEVPLAEVDLVSGQSGSRAARWP